MRGSFRERPLKRIAHILVPIVALAGALTGASQHRKPAAPPKPSQPEAIPDSRIEAIRENNTGIAFMEERRFPEALAKFQGACIADTDSDIGCLNMGIAFLAMQHFDDARRVLTKAASKDGQNPRVWFNLGLLEKTVGQNKAALQDFEKAAKLDPTDSDIQYFLGALYEQDHDDAKATAAYLNAVKLNPFEASAELGLAEVAEHAGNVDSALVHLTRFRQLTSQDLGEPVSVTYGQQGKYSRAEELPREIQAPGPAVPVRFTNVTPSSGLSGNAASPARGKADLTRRKKDSDDAREPENGEDVASGGQKIPLAQFLGSGACVFDYDGDGKPDIFLVNGDGNGNGKLYRNLGELKFADVTKAAKLEFQGEGTGCAVGDYDNDGHPDLAVSSNGGVHLYHNQGDGTFQDVTAKSGIQSSGLAMGVAFIDYDQDGDPDLYVTQFNDFPLDEARRPFSFPYDEPQPGNILWRNKGNGTFMNWTKELGLSGAAASVGAIAADVNNDHAVDFVIAGWEKVPEILINQREGAFRAIAPWAGQSPGPSAGIAALDFNKDGWVDLAFTHWASQALSLWRNVGGKSFERVPLADPGWMRGWGITAWDYDNDGWTDIVAVGENFAGEGRIIALRNEGPNGFRDVTQETGLDTVVLRDPRAIIAFDAQGDGSTELLITQNNLPPVLLKGAGGNKNNWLRLAFKGKDENKLGTGAEVEVFDGADEQKLAVPGASGYLGQGPPEIGVGLGAQSIVDVLRVLWPTGTVQHELQVQALKREIITQFDRRDAQQQ
jgi:tetratricopeptide (TPR) repeat protein